MAQAIQKPHEQDSHHIDPRQRAMQTENLKFAMWLFIASEVIIFAVLIGAYIVFRLDAQNAEVIHEVHEEIGLGLVSLNTFLLLASSWTMVMGLRAMQLNNHRGGIQWLTYTAIIGVLFVILQAVEYAALANIGVTIYGSEFGMRFYAPTTLHGAHVIGGVIWALAVIRHAARGGYRESTAGVEIFGLYWHFVDVVWIVIFTVIYLI